MAQNWYYAKDDKKHGPVSVAQLKELAGNGGIARSDLVWRDGLSEWVPGRRINGLFPSQAESPPIPGRSSPPNLPRSTTANPSLLKKIDNLPKWVNVLIVVGVILVISALRIACERNKGSRRPNSGSYSAPSSLPPGSRRPNSGSYSAPPSLPPGVTDPDLWAQVLRAYPDTSREYQIFMYQALVRKRVHEQRMRSIQKMFTP
jgi:hypothetical protein